MPTWSHEQDLVLADGWRDGKSAGEIAKAIGPEMSRAAVAKRRKRMGLPARTGAALDAAQAHQGKACGTGLRATVRSPGRPLGAAMAARLGPLVGSTPRPWVQRAYGECCFPVGGGGADTLSCCLPVVRTGLYCLGHAEILKGHPWPPEEVRHAVCG